MRKFHKISKEQLSKDVQPVISTIDYLYDHIQLPERSTKYSAGYDIRAVGDYVINSNCTVLIPTGLKVEMEENDVLLLIIRSSLGIKKRLSIPNQVGVIDHDYFNNPDNEGHFWIALRNDGDAPFEIHNGDRLCQGIFVTYNTTTDDNSTGDRVGGIGSTGD